MFKNRFAKWLFVDNATDHLKSMKAVHNIDASIYFRVKSYSSIWFNFLVENYDIVGVGLVVDSATNWYLILSAIRSSSM